MKQDVEYHWVTAVTPSEYHVSTWEGKASTISKRGIIATPDRDIDGKPICKKIGNGKMAQYFRFEKIRAETAA